MYHQPKLDLDGKKQADAKRLPALPCLNSISSMDSYKKLSSYHAKVAFALAQNVAWLVSKYGIDRIGFLTITTGGKNGLSMKEFQRRYNSLNTNFLKKRYEDSIMVMERGEKGGRVHAHLLIVCPSDIRSGCNVRSLQRGDYSSANRSLRDEWSIWRSVAPRYGFGRCEILPLRSNAQAIAKYVSKYVAKQVVKRIKQDRGVKLVRYSSGVRACSTRFAFASVRSLLWRKKVKAVAEKLGFNDLSDFSSAFGDKWCLPLARSISGLKLTAYSSRIEAEADGQTLLDAPDDLTDITIRGQGGCVDSYTSETLEQFLRKDSRIYDALSTLMESMRRFPGDFNYNVDGLPKAHLGRFWKGGEYIYPEHFEFNLDPQWDTEDAFMRASELECEPF